MAEIIDCTKCAFYNNGKCDNPNGMACSCVNNAVCYFKELKRLEQENAKLKAENERLQKLTCFNCGEETLSPSGAELYDKILVYKQTLRELKSIAERELSLTEKGDELYDVFSEILQILTKAEEQ